MGRRAPSERVTRTQARIAEVRAGDACIPIRDARDTLRAGVPVWVEQERHLFPFGCAVPELTQRAEAERERYQARLHELFNYIVPADQTALDSTSRRVEVTEPVHLGLLHRRLEELARDGGALEVHVWGDAVGMTEGGDERAAGKRAADLYTLCFAHAAVSRIVWHGLADGDADARGGGLLRRDLAPTYAYHALRKLITLDWHTRADGVSDADGVFHFRGFFGDYRVGIDVDESALRVETFALRPGRPP